MKQDTAVGQSRANGGRERTGRAVATASLASLLLGGAIIGSFAALASVGRSVGWLRR